MKGAREYAKLFETGRYGRLYITSGKHARGDTFHIHVLPKDVAEMPNGSQNPFTNKGAIEVYGVISGNPGWTESYGWLHKGKWQDDFEKLVTSKRMEVDSKLKREIGLTKQSERIKRQKTKELLSNY